MIRIVCPWEFLGRSWWKGNVGGIGQLMKSEKNLQNDPEPVRTRRGNSGLGEEKRDKKYFTAKK